MSFIENAMTLLMFIIIFIGVLVVGVFLDDFLQRNRRRIQRLTPWRRK